MSAVPFPSIYYESGYLTFPHKIAIGAVAAGAISLLAIGIIFFAYSHQFTSATTGFLASGGGVLLIDVGVLIYLIVKDQQKQEELAGAYPKESIQVRTIPSNRFLVRDNIAYVQKLDGTKEVHVFENGGEAIKSGFELEEQGITKYWEIEIATGAQAVFHGNGDYFGIRHYLICGEISCYTYARWNEEFDKLNQHADDYSIHHLRHGAEFSLPNGDASTFHCVLRRSASGRRIIHFFYKVDEEYQEFVAQLPPKPR